VVGVVVAAGDGLEMVESASRGGVSDRVIGEFVECVLRKFGAGKPMVNPARVSALFRDRSNAGMRLQFNGRHAARAVGSKDGQEARTANGAGTGETVEQVMFGMLSKQ